MGGAFIYSALATLDLIFSIIQWFILVWVIISWAVFFAASTSFRWKHPQFYHVLLQLNEFFTRATNPILRPFRRLLPPHKTGGIDWSPLLLLVAIYFIRTFLMLGVRSILH